MSNKLEAALGGGNTLTNPLADEIVYAVHVDGEVSKKMVRYLAESGMPFAVTAGKVWLSEESAALLADKNWSEL